MNHFSSISVKFSFADINILLLELMPFWMGGQLLFGHGFDLRMQ
jgi:hypothetical protein